MNILVIYPNGNALNPHSGAETRFWNLVSALTSLNFRVTVLHSLESKGFEDNELKSRCNNVFYIKRLGFLGLSDFYFTDFNPFFIFTLRKILRKKRFDIILVEFPWGFLITKFLAKKDTFIIYESQGIESEFIEIAAKNPKFPKFFGPFIKIYGKIYENLVCKFANLIVSVSEVDRDYYERNYGIDKRKTVLIQTPSALTHKYIERTDSNKKEHRKKLDLPLDKTIVIFHGGLPHPPNQQAFDLIENYISPKIQNPDILFVLAGYNVKKYIKDNIISLGFISNLRDLLYSADFAIVPLISGSGMRIKCTDYIITALPFITTKKGIEGIEFVDPNKDYLVYDSVDDNFISGIIELYRNKELRQKLHENLLRKSNIYNRKNFEARFSKLFKILIKSKK
ncbi:MAG: glycosyltransferase family 4 protein [Promethearchaeota archaeon]